MQFMATAHELVVSRGSLSLAGSPPVGGLQPGAIDPIKRVAPRKLETVRLRAAALELSRRATRRPL